MLFRRLFSYYDAAEVFGIAVAVGKDEASGGEDDVGTVRLSGTILDWFDLRVIAEDGPDRILDDFLVVGVNEILPYPVCVIHID